MWRGQSGNRRGNLRLLLAMLAVDAIVLAAFFSSDRPVTYHHRLPELFTDFERLRHRSLRVEGELERGSLYRVKDACEFRFRLSTYDKARALDVRYPIDQGYPWARRDCALPDTFCDAPGYEMEAVVEGTLERDARGTYFVATRLFARCPTVYKNLGPRDTWPKCRPIPVRA